VIEPTDEMKAAFRAAQNRRAEELVAENAPLGGHDILDRGLAAVLAIVARDRCMEARGHVRLVPVEPPRCGGQVVTFAPAPCGRDYTHRAHDLGLPPDWAS
jgi:hypothetical protein